MYRKKTHTDQYLNFASHHPFEHKLSVVRMLLHRADTVVRDPEDKAEEISHVKEALQTCGYTEWTIFRACSKEKQAATAAVMLKIVNIYLPHFLVWRACQKSMRKDQQSISLMKQGQNRLLESTLNAVKNTTSTGRT